MKHTATGFLAAAFALPIAWAEAAVTISSSPTANMSCSAGVCAPTASDAVLNAGDLEALLASGNVEVTTTGSGVQASDIRVAAIFAWSSASTLSLDAYKSIAITRPVTVSGSGGVSLVTNHGGSGGEFSVDGKGHLTLRSTSALSINGASYALAGNIAQLAAVIYANPSGNVALARDYDASADGTYATPPVATVFSGNFNGLGNTISNLTINDPTENAYVGLFAESVSGATLANIRLTNENVTGGSGSSHYDSTEFIGGLVGYGNGCAIFNAFAGGVISGGDYSAAGGLIGVGGATIKASGAAMSVSNGAYSNAGGLLGAVQLGASITDSYASGNVSSTFMVGGLVAFDDAAVISHSYATGRVTGTTQYSYAGGLVGVNQYGNIDRSYATGAVACAGTCGGLAGFHELFSPGEGVISRSFATGSVTSQVWAGGLVGFNAVGVIKDSYATGAVSAPGAGGLIGDNSGSNELVAISRSYSSGAVAGNAGETGGLIGWDQFEVSGDFRHAYWDTDTSGITNLSQGAGNISNDPGIKGLTTAQFQSGLPKGFAAKIWAENPAINGGLPYLLANPPPK